MKSRGFIANDRDCQCVTARWSFEPIRGCRVTLREELEYDGQKDFAGSLSEGYRAIRKRKAAGGPGWNPK